MKGNITYRPFDDGLQSWRHCDWLVILPKLSSVRLKFLDFDLPPADFGHCQQGFLILGTFDTKGKYCDRLMQSMIMLVHKHTGDAGIVYLVPAYIIPWS